MMVNWQLGVSAWSVNGGCPSVEFTHRPPMLITLFGKVAPGIAHRALSISCTP